MHSLKRQGTILELNWDRFGSFASIREGWRQLLVKHQSLPSPCSWGYTQTEDGWKPVYRTKPTAADACKDIIVKCSCRVSCQGNCSCRKKNQKCTDLCSCSCVSN
ncbi:Chromosome-associated kinesin KIF4 [Frankliniella fusca]|uniref:Chromosome-associated kinesin KIF4 n=1 Tax=Frankliniella fusca TaxID=407009 RepID=A0AAE1HEL0_9NEOP|nr:Chromosome-associated kinesin KIF4 [Frankliniella fusca]